MMVSPLNKQQATTSNAAIACSSLDHSQHRPSFYPTEVESDQTEPVLTTEASPYFEAKQLSPSSSDVALGGGF